VDKLSTLLRNRYGGTRQADKYRMELPLRRRRHGESLSNLHQDIRRLMALAHPSLPHQECETIACDYYIDALGDADPVLKLRERVPASLGDALRCFATVGSLAEGYSALRSEHLWFSEIEGTQHCANQVAGADDKQLKNKFASIRDRCTSLLGWVKTRQSGTIFPKGPVSCRKNSCE